MSVRIITRTEAHVESFPQAFTWQHELKRAYKTPNVLLARLNIDPAQWLNDGDAALADQQFATLVPEPFVAQMEMGNINDPLLRQVLPIGEEMQPVSGFVKDPLQEQDTNVRPGIIHKYQGRILLMAATHCAINCRYCFRRHFPYSDNRSAKRDWHATLAYVAQDPSIHEVILSGGDPLMLNDAQLSELIEAIEAIDHVKRLRIHSRLPVVIPQRLTLALEHRLSQSRLEAVLVLHVNHPNELSEQHRKPLHSLRAQGITLLNQSVLLREVNDSLTCLKTLSERLFEFGVLPYYLHQVDEVEGAAHFEVSRPRADELYQQLQASLSGYLVPTLVKEQPEQPNKTRL